MTALFAVEVRRLLGRRLLYAFGAAGVLGALIAGIAVYARSDSTFALGDMRGVLQGTTVPIVLATWVIGASFIGAEWRAGTVATLLTWEPRRGRVMASKALAGAVMTAGFTVALQAFIAASLVPGALKHGQEDLSTAWLGDIAPVIWKGAALAAIASVIGFALAALGRNTALALGVGFVYLAILEGNLLGALFPGIRRWLLIGNAIVFVSGHPHHDIAGRSAVGAGLLLAVYSVGILALATAWFRARDVT